jgi:hypothetical protein
VDREAELRGLDTSSFIRMTLRRVRIDSERNTPQVA